MSVLLRASELEGRSIVTFAGESPAEVKDVIFDSLNGTLLGMTLRGHGLFSRSRKDILPWSRIHGIGRDAVMIRDEGAFQGEGALPAEGVPDNRNVLGNQVLTDGGTDVGRVVDVIIEAGADAANLSRPAYKRRLQRDYREKLAAARRHSGADPASFVVVRR